MQAPVSAPQCCQCSHLNYDPACTFYSCP
jgi:hypothetical protein